MKLKQRWKDLLQSLNDNYDGEHFKNVCLHCSGLLRDVPPPFNEFF